MRCLDKHTFLNKGTTNTLQSILSAYNSNFASAFIRAQFRHHLVLSNCLVNAKSVGYLSDFRLSGAVSRCLATLRAAAVEAQICMQQVENVDPIDTRTTRAVNARTHNRAAIRKRSLFVLKLAAVAAAGAVAIVARTRAGAARGDADAALERVLDADLFADRVERVHDTQRFVQPQHRALRLPGVQTRVHLLVRSK